MWLKLLPFSSFIFACLGCTFYIESKPPTGPAAIISNPYVNPEDPMHKVYYYQYIVVNINCGENLYSFSTRVNTENILMLICTNSSYEGYEPSYYKDILSDLYNISSDAEYLAIAFGSKEDSLFHTKRLTVFGKKRFWEKCKKLRELNIRNSDLSYVQERFPSGLSAEYTSLNKLDIRDTPTSTEAVTHILQGGSLKELTIRNCGLYDLPNNFVDLTPELVRLDLSHNHLRFMPIEPALKKSPVLKNLEFIDLSYNDLQRKEVVVYTNIVTPRLRYMILDHNIHLDTCENHIFNDQLTIPENLKWAVFPDIRMVSASFTSTSRLCYGLMKTDNLVVLNISHSMVSTLSELPASTAPNSILDLRGNDITDIKYIGIKEYEAINTRFMESKLTVLANVKLQCDCQYSWLQKALQGIPNLNIQDISCSNGIQLLHQKWDSLNCTKFNCGDCVCRRSAKSATAHCTSGISRTIPLEKNLSHIYAAANRIEYLNASLFNDKLVWIDISANRISRLDLKTIRVMFSMEGRHFRLAGNPIICDCSNQELLSTLRLHRHQVDDYTELTCVGGGVSLDSVKEDQLCDSEQMISTVIWITLVILVLTTFIYYRYRYQINIFLYARGWLLCCIRENDMDENRPYDVFISFAHEDEEFVADKLLPGLEMGATAYKTCVHLRDWVPGEMIPTQIIKSIESSRRTLVVVSKSYLKSLWGLMEFHTAHARAMDEKRIRVVVIFLEDLCEDDVLDPVLRLYMQTNTYLRWGDHWFWDKLRYALPHKPAR